MYTEKIKKKMLRVGRKERKKENRPNGSSCVGLRENESAVVCENSRWRDVWWWWCSCLQHTGLTAVISAGQGLSAVTVTLSHTGTTGFQNDWRCVFLCVRVTEFESVAPFWMSVDFLFPHSGYDRKPITACLLVCLCVCVYLHANDLWNVHVKRERLSPLFLNLEIKCACLPRCVWVCGCMRACACTRALGCVSLTSWEIMGGHARVTAFLAWNTFKTSSTLQRHCTDRCATTRFGAAFLHSFSANKVVVTVSVKSYFLINTVCVLLSEMNESLTNPFRLLCSDRKKEYMSRRMSERDRQLSERHLFHGTSADVVEGICKHNFDPRVCGKHATMFGQGSYFARKAVYSHNFSKRSPKGVHCMFLAKVLTGR